MTVEEARRLGYKRFYYETSSNPDLAPAVVSKIRVFKSGSNSWLHVWWYGYVGLWHGTIKRLLSL
jgi:hypothetical protein